MSWSSSCVHIYFMQGHVCEKSCPFFHSCDYCKSFNADNKLLNKKYLTLCQIDNPGNPLRASNSYMKHFDILVAKNEH